jgi:acetoin utilization deacetylase AcuC-like enzyme
MIPIFYRPEQSCDEAVRVSPSAGKPALVIAEWRARPSIAALMEVKSFEPITYDVLYAVHSKAYVDGVLSCQRSNGFGTKSPNIAASLCYTTGSLLAAAMHVLSNKRAGLNVTVSPTSGFHHAAYADGGGFCTFNGLMATAIHVHALGLAKRILIVDMDQHYGDGTDDIIEQLGIDFVDHITAGKSYRSAEQALRCCDLGNVQPRQYELVLYQAGADIHVNDPLGGLLTTEQMSQRDRSVFSACARLGLPIVWNLAGGYQRDAKGGIEPVLALHRNTMVECIRYHSMSPEAVQPVESAQ